jgi:hypothetical protein
MFGKTVNRNLTSCVYVMMMIFVVVVVFRSKVRSIYRGVCVVVVFFLHVSAAYFCNFNSTTTYNGFAEP